jgi:uncharacterized protein (DUF488 family)
MIIYTIGYTGSSYEDLRRFIEATNSVLCDIRFSPLSRVPMWRYPVIAEAVGRDNYVYVRALGNLNYKNGREVELCNPQLGASTVEDIFAKGRNVILMCACRDVYECHRWDAARYVAYALATDSPDSIHRIVHLPARYADWKEAA